MKTIALILVVAASAVAVIIDHSSKMIHAVMTVSYPNNEIIDRVNISQQMYSVKIDRGFALQLPPGKYVGVVHETQGFKDNCDPPTPVVQIKDPREGHPRPLVAFYRVTVNEEGSIYSSWSSETSLILQHEDSIVNRTIFFYNITSGNKDFLEPEQSYFGAPLANITFPPVVACARVTLYDSMEPKRLKLIIQNRGN